MGRSNCWRAQRRFSPRARSGPPKPTEELKAELYQQIGKLQGEADGLKKKVRAVALAERRRWIEAGGEGLRGVRQCELAGVSRSGLYYRPRGRAGGKASKGFSENCSDYLPLSSVP